MSTTRRTAGVYSRQRPLDAEGKKICYNCGGPLPKGRPFNCSPACSKEWRLKTSPSLVRQEIAKRDHGVCAVCGVDAVALQTEYRSLLKAGNAEQARWRGGPGTPAELFREKWQIPDSRASTTWWDADHITPVIEGGGECGIENFRTLCIPCHRKVTKDLAARLAAQRRAEKITAAKETLAKPLRFGDREPVLAAQRLRKLQSRQEPV